MYNTILQQKSTMSSDTPKSISENILDFILRQMFRPSLLPKGFFQSLVQNIFCPLENQIRIQHLCIRELNSLEYHGDISSFFRSRGCQSIVRNTYSLLCIQSRWNEIPGAGFSQSASRCSGSSSLCQRERDGRIVEGTRFYPAYRGRLI